MPLGLNVTLRFFLFQGKNQLDFFLDSFRKPVKRFLFQQVWGSDVMRHLSHHYFMENLQEKDIE